MTVKELIEMLETCDKESIVYINCADDRFVIITTTIK